MTKQKTTDQLVESRLSFAGLLRWIEFDVDLSPKRKRDLTSSLRSFCRLLDINLEHSTAGIAPYRDKLNIFDPAIAGISRKRWSNIRSDVSAAFSRYSIRQGARPAPSDLSPDWHCLREEAKRADTRLVRGLSRFVHYSNSQGTAPDRVDDRVMEAFGRFLANETMHRKPRQAHRGTCILWNRAVDQVADWPKQKVNVPSYRNSFSLPLNAFPDTFQSDLASWLDQLSGKDLLASDAPVRPLRRATLHGKREQVRRLASALVASDYPIDQVTSLKCLVALPNFRRALNWYLEHRSGGQSTPSLFELASAMLGMVKHHVKVSEDHLEKLRQLVKRLRCRKKGLTQKNREILRQFDDPPNMWKLLDLPEILAAKAKKQRNARKAALMIQTALAIEIEISAPIRLKNLTKLRLDHHFDYSRAGRHGIVHLVIPEVEVKNREPLEFELPKSVIKLLEHYRRFALPQLSSDSTTWLFPGAKGGAKHNVTLAGQIVTAIRRYSGLRMTVHAFRHLAAKIYLDKNPGAYALVSRLLGHKSIQTTMDFYTGLESKSAGIAYDQEILRLRGDKPRKPR